jgi:protein-L-isoaspartate(D-aspartate) O-methyltransferase
LERLTYYVYSLERQNLLAERAGENLHYHNFHNVDVHVGDGSQGLPDMSPFDVIVVNATAPRIPLRLVAQLNPNGGRMVIPIGYGSQPRLHLVKRDGNSFGTQTLQNVAHVSFERLIGRYGFPSDAGKDKSDSAHA